MPRPWRITYAGAMYHVTSRGNGRERVFLCDDDCERFLEQLDAALEKDEVTLYAYVLMPNHYHLLVRTPLGNIKRFMQRLNTAYGMYFRFKHRKPGHCFQGRYGAKLVGGDEYIIRLTRYIHLNPVKTEQMKSSSAAEKVRALDNWRWSSYGGYVDESRGEERIDYRWLKLMHRATQKGRREAYRGYIARMLTSDDEELKVALGMSRYAVGDEGFIRESESDLREMEVARYIEGDVIRPKERVSEIGVVEIAVSREFGVKVQDLHYDGHRAGLAKTVAVELSCRLTGKSQREVGMYYGYGHESSVGKQRKLLASLTAGDAGLAKRIDKLAGEVLRTATLLSTF
jgi:putative transposase